VGCPAGNLAFKLVVTLPNGTAVFAGGMPYLTAVNAAASLQFINRDIGTKYSKCKIL
jgi:hypothetical protein